MRQNLSLGQANPWVCASWLSFCLATTAAIAQNPLNHAAHSHGAGTLELSIQAGRAEGRFEIPMESLLGHEHLPRTDAQKKAMADLKSGLASIEYLITWPVAAKCKQLALRANSSMFEGKKSEHADLDVDFSMECAEPSALTEIRLVVFDKHPKLKTLKVEWVGPKGQKSITLTPKASVLRF